MFYLSVQSPTDGHWIARGCFATLAEAEAAAQRYDVPARVLNASGQPITTPTKGNR